MFFTNFLGLLRNPTRATANVVRTNASHLRLPSGGSGHLSISPPPSYGNLTVRSLSADTVTLRPRSRELTVRSHASTGTIRPSSNSAPTSAVPTYRSLPDYSSQLRPENGHRVLQHGEEGLSVESARRRYAEAEEELVHGAEREDNHNGFHIPAYVLQDTQGRTRQLQQPRATRHRPLRDINFNPPAPTEQTTTATVAEQSLAPAPTRALRRRDNFRFNQVQVPNRTIEEAGLGDVSGLQVVRRRPTGRRQGPDLSGMFNNP